MALCLLSSGCLELTVQPTSSRTLTDIVLRSELRNRSLVPIRVCTGAIGAYRVFQAGRRVRSGGWLPYLEDPRRPPRRWLAPHQTLEYPLLDISRYDPFRDARLFMYSLDAGTYRIQFDYACPGAIPPGT